MRTIFSHPLADTPITTLGHDAVREQLQKLPKIDLHRHLEGSLTPSMLLALADKYSIELPAASEDTLRPHVQITDSDHSLIDFLSKFETIGNIFVSPAACEYIAHLVVTQAAAENIVYLELRFSPQYMAQAYSLNPVEVTEAVLAGMRRASNETNSICNAILIVERQRSLACAEEVVAIASQFSNSRVVAVDLANNEASFPPGLFGSVFTTAKMKGLGITIHAAEAAGPENMLTAVQQLHANRIGHGVRLNQNADIEKTIVQAEIPLELCFTSNIQTGAVQSAAAFPLRHFIAAGVAITLNTDDPGVSNTSMADELFLASIQANLTLTELHKILVTSARVAFASDATRTQLEISVTDGMYRLAESLKDLPAEIRHERLS